jgi:hypothetical protein
LLNGFDNFSGFNAPSADLHSSVITIVQTDANGLQIRVKATTSAVVGVRDIITELRSFAAYFTTFCHNLLLPPELLLTGWHHTGRQPTNSKTQFIANLICYGQARTPRIRVLHSYIEGVENLQCRNHI